MTFRARRELRLTPPLATAAQLVNEFDAFARSLGSQRQEILDRRQASTQGMLCEFAHRVGACDPFDPFLKLCHSLGDSEVGNERCRNYRGVLTAGNSP